MEEQDKLNQLLENKNLGVYSDICSNQITNISLLYIPILDYQINLVKLFDLFKVDRTIWSII